MEVGAAAVLISSIAAAYALAIWYVGTRWIVRALRDTPAEPVRLQVCIDDDERTKLA